MNKTNVLVIDDSAVVRGILSKLIDKQDDMTIVGTAANGKIGVAKASQLEPDIVILDIEMPVMTGLEAVVEIRRNHPKLPVVMFSTLTSSGAEVTMRCMRAGATDFALKPSSNSEIILSMETVLNDLLNKIRSIVGVKRHAPERPSAPVKSSATKVTRLAPQAVVIGSSTGGPAALELVLSGISRPLPVPTFIVQHMPPVFTKALADRLDRKVASHVVEAEDGQIAEAGTCYIAPGAAHLRLERAGASTKISLFDGPPVNSCKPSVEPLFESAAKIYGPRVIAAIFTGMGADGVDGSGILANLGSHVLAQDEASCVVYGMPRAVVEAGHATEVLPLDQMARRLDTLASGGHLSRQAA